MSKDFNTRQDKALSEFDIPNMPQKPRQQLGGMDPNQSDSSPFNRKPKNKKKQRKRKPGNAYQPTETRSWQSREF